MACSISKKIILLLTLLLSFSIERTGALDSCCLHKLERGEPVPEFIDDPNDPPPFVWEGEPQYIDDPNDTKPEYWDDEDDGDWAPVRILNPKYTWKPRQIPNPDYVAPPTYWDKLRVELQAATPWVTLGVLLTGILSLIPLPLETLQWCLQPLDEDDSSNGLISLANRLVRLLSAALLGLATPLCSCGALPLCAGLLKQGVPFSSALVFLTAAQSAGLDSAAITYGLLGAPAMIGRLVGAIALAMAVGLIAPFDQTRKKGSKGKNACNNDTSHGSRIASSAASSATLTNVLANCFETATEIYPTVLMGLVLSTAALHYLPSLTSYVSSSSKDENGADLFPASTLLPHDVGMRLLLLVSAVPLQLCEHTSVTLAAAIQKGGGSSGLAFAFLLSAPATNFPTMLWIWNSGYERGLFAMLVSLCGTALLLSYLVDAAHLDLMPGESIGEMTRLPGWLSMSSPYLAGSMLAAGWYQKYFLNSRSKLNDESESCGNCCSSAVEKTKAE